MITFKEFLLKEWHIITDEDFLLIESLDPVKWKQHDDTHVHKTTIDGKRLAIYIDQHHHGNYVTQHSVRFEVNGTLSKKKRTNSATGKKILLHVARAVNSYTNEHTDEFEKHFPNHANHSLDTVFRKSRMDHIKTNIVLPKNNLLLAKTFLGIPHKDL